MIATSSIAMATSVNIRKHIFNAGMKPNIAENPCNRQKPKRGRKRFFDDALYAHLNRLDTGRLHAAGAPSKVKEITRNPGIPFVLVTKQTHLAIALSRRPASVSIPGRSLPKAVLREADQRAVLS